MWIYTQAGSKNDTSKGEHMRKMIDMAEEAGMTGLEDGGLFDNFLVFEALIRADEQKAIIDLVAMYGGPVDLEAAIRARGETK